MSRQRRVIHFSYRKTGPSFLTTNANDLCVNTKHKMRSIHTLLDKSIRRLVRVAVDMCELEYRLEILWTCYVKGRCKIIQWLGMPSFVTIVRSVRELFSENPRGVASTPPLCRPGLMSRLSGFRDNETGDARANVQLCRHLTSNFCKSRNYSVSSHTSNLAQLCNRILRYGDEECTCARA